MPGLAQQRTFQETTDVVVVEVPVTVVYEGQPLTELTADSFELLSDGKPQKIVGFEVIDLRTLDAEEAPKEIPIAARRHFLLLFDLSFSLPESIVKARRAALDLVEGLHPSDLAGVGVYTATRGADFVLGFTSDRRQLELAVNTLGSPRLVERARDPLGLLLGDLQPSISRDFFTSDSTESGGPGGGSARDGIAEALQEGLEADLMRITAAETTDLRRRVQAMTRSMEDMANVLAGIEGQKHVVYFSEGFDERVLIGEARDQQGSDAIASGEIWKVSGQEAYGDTGLQNDYEGMIEHFRRAGCIVQAIDIAGLRSTDRSNPAQTALFAFADGTGGELYNNMNDLGAAVGKMLQRTSVTYLLAFQPKKLKTDGKYHKIKVKLEGAPRGARLSHRTGFYAPKPTDKITETEDRLSKAEAILGESVGGPFPVDLLAAPFPVAGEEAYVPVLLEVDGPRLLAESSGPTLALEIYAYAIGESGSVQDFFAENIGLDLGQVEATMKQTGFKYWGHFDLPPGSYTARVMVRDTSNRRFTTARQAFTVPVFDQQEAKLLPPFFPEAPGKWVLGREGEARQRQVAYPFMMGEQPIIPAARPVVPGKGAAPFYLQSLNLAGDVRFSGEVLGSDEQPVQQASVELQAPQVAGGVQTVVAQLTTKGLKPGEYTLVARAVDAAGEHRSTIRFAVE
jgi:VWFA-related protein